MIETVEDVKKTGRQFGQKVGTKEAKAILGVLKGWRGGPYDPKTWKKEGK